jgi:hypothetical protein
MERVRRIRSMSSAGDAVQVVAGAGVDVYLGHTRFTKPNAVAVDGRGLHFNKAVIATGSRPVAPTIEGLREGEYLTNETVFSLTELPRRLVVLVATVGLTPVRARDAAGGIGSSGRLHPSSRALPGDFGRLGGLARRRVVGGRARRPRTALAVNARDARCFGGRFP